MKTRKAKPKSSYKPSNPLKAKTTTSKVAKSIKTASKTKRHTPSNLSPSSLSPPFSHLYEPNNPHNCLICLDLGTSKIEIAYAINAERNVDPLKVKINKFQLQHGWSRLPALVAIEPNFGSTTHAQLIFGKDVERALRNQSTSPDYVWSDLKQGRFLIDPDEPAFKEKRIALYDTQQKHERTLRVVQRFKEVVVKYPRGSIEVFYPNSSRESGRQRLEFVEDVFVILLRWTLDYVKSAFSSASGITDTAEIDNLFGSPSVQIGVAVPDMLPPSSVTKYYGLLIRSGFDDSVHMLSEAKCAAIKVAKDRFSETDAHQSLKSSLDRDIDVCDIGHGTTDISTIRIAWKDSMMRFEFVVDATGNASGGKTIDDEMIAKLRALFQNQLRAWVPRDFRDDSVKIEEEIFLEGFRQGIAEAKCDMKGNGKDNERVCITYYGPGRFPRDESIGDIQIHGRAIILPASMLVNCYDTFLKPIVQLSRARSERKGLLEQHYSAVATQGLVNSERFFFLVGGGAVPQYTQDRIRNALKEIPATARTELVAPAVRDEAFVAEGGVLMLSDRRLCQRRFHNESLGCVMQSADNPDGMDRVNWFYMIGQKIDDNKDIDEMFYYTIELINGEDPSEDTFCYPIDFKWRFARTSNEKCGQIQFPRTQHPEIRLDQYIHHELDRGLCEFIGWKLQASGDYSLTFSFRLQVRLKGDVVSFKATIPEGGVFDDGKDHQPTRSFVSRMTANISHLRDEDKYY